MVDWKNTFNLKDFIKNSDEDLAKIFLEEFNILIDGYTPFSMPMGEANLDKVQRLNLTLGLYY
jgi:hypothetical protein